MNDESEVCLTFETAVQAAIDMENRIYNNSLEALRIVKDQAAREILHEAATAKLAHEHKLSRPASTAV
jgi:hypothetical protein